VPGCSYAFENVQSIKRNFEASKQAAVLDLVSVCRLFARPALRRGWKHKQLTGLESIIVVMLDWIESQARSVNILVSHFVRKKSDLGACSLFDCKREVRGLVVPAYRKHGLVRV
jgi:hypothetical protein